MAVEGGRAAASRTAVFAREGEFWTVAYEGRVCRVRDAKGMGHLARLLRHPGEEVPALELAGFGVEGGDAGPVLDGRAVAAYKRRVMDLRAEVDEAEAYGDPARAAARRAELDALVHQLAGALGLGGRQRRAGSPVERARLSTTKAIRGALARLAAADPVLGAHLDATVRTGTTCCYRPDPQAPVVWRDRVDTTSPPEAPAPRPGAPALVGRDGELTELRRRLEAAVRGSGSIVLLGGDPGIGKTRLVEELAARRAAEHGVRTLVGRCLEAGATVAYLPFVEIVESLASSPDGVAALGADVTDLARLAPAVAGVLDVPVPPQDLPADHARRSLFAAVTRTTGRLARRDPLLVVVEDLHWADDGTLALLEHLAGHVEGWPVLVVATHRLAEAEPGTALAHTLERLLRRPHVRRLVLEPLDPPAVAALVAALHGGDPPAGVVDRLAVDTGGNPLFVCQLYQHLVDRDALGGDEPVDLPEDLRLLLAHRVGRLSPPAREVLTLAAVAGDDVDEVLLVAAGAPAATVLDALDEAVAARLLVALDDAEPDGGRYRFVHALVAHAVLAELTPARRRRLHLGWADAIEHVHGADPARAVAVADHLVGAGQEAGAARVAAAQRRAAQRLMEVAAHEAAVRRLDRALARCPDREGAEIAALLAARGDAHGAQGSLTDAVVDWQAALARAEREPGCAALAAELCERLGRSLDLVGDVAGAAATARRGLDLAGPDASPARGRLLATLAHPLSLLGAHDEAAGLCAEAEEIADRHGDRRLLGEARASAGLLAFTRGDHADGAERAGEATDLLLEAGALWSAAVPASMVLLQSLLVGDMASVEAAAATAADLAARSGHVGAELWRVRCASWVALMHGGDARRFAEEADADVATCRTHRLRWLADALVNAGTARARLGDAVGAARLLDEAAAMPHPPVYIGRYSAPALVLCAAQGDRDGFTARRADIERQLHAAGLAGRRTMGTQVYALSVVEGAALLGEWDVAAELAPQVEVALRRGLVLRPSDLRPVVAIAALAAAAVGDRRLAARRLDEAFALTEALPHRADVPALERVAAALA